jgi:hypothetical protein
MILFQSNTYICRWLRAYVLSRLPIFDCLTPSTDLDMISSVSAHAYLLLESMNIPTEFQLHQVGQTPGSDIKNFDISREWVPVQQDQGCKKLIRAFFRECLNWSTGSYVCGPDLVP